MLKDSKQVPDGHSSNDGGSRIFSCLPDILAYFGQSAPDRDAILAPGRLPVTYGELWARTNDTVRVLRGLNIGPSDRVAVVLPNGPDAAMAILMVAAGSVCVPLNPGYTAREWQHHFQDLQISALLTCTGAASASRDAATAFGIPIIDLVPKPNEGSSAFRLLGAATSSVGKPALAPKSGDAFILLTSGTASLPKGVPLTQAAVCRSAYNVGSTLALKPRDRLLNVLPLFHVHGLVSGVLAALASGSSVICTTGFDAAKFFGDLKQFSPTWYTAVPAIHQAVLSAARVGAVGAKSVFAASHSIRLFDFAVLGVERAGRTVRSTCDRYVRHDRGRVTNCRKPREETQARFCRPTGGVRSQDHG